MTHKHFFTIEDATYAYSVYGKGIPVVFLHGFTGSQKTWKPFVEKWKHRFQCITIDLPGHGKTKTNLPRTMEACCHDLRTLFSHLGISSFHLIGYSMGGRVALSFAMLYPQFLLSLTLESSSPGLKTFAKQKARQAQDEQLAQKIQTKGLKAFIDDWENIPLFSTQKNLPLSVQQSIRIERESQTEEGLVQSLRWMGTGVQPSWWNQLSRLSLPVLLLVGALDKKFVQINQEMQENFQDATLKIVPEAGHAVHLEKPEDFHRIVKSFIKEIDK